MKDFQFKFKRASNDIIIHGARITDRFYQYQEEARAFCIENDGSIIISERVDELLQVAVIAACRQTIALLTLIFRAINGVFILRRNKCLSEIMKRHVNVSTINLLYKKLSQNFVKADFPDSLSKDLKALLKVCDSRHCANMNIVN